MSKTPNLAPNDLGSFWMPFTANRQFKANPRMFVSAKDMHYTTDDGRQILDGTAGLWCVNAGHSRPKIVKANPVATWFDNRIKTKNAKLVSQPSGRVCGCVGGYTETEQHEM